MRADHGPDGGGRQDAAPRDVWILCFDGLYFFCCAFIFVRPDFTGDEEEFGLGDGGVLGGQIVHKKLP